MSVFAISPAAAAKATPTPALGRAFDLPGVGPARQRGATLGELAGGEGSPGDLPAARRPADARDAQGAPDRAGPPDPKAKAAALAFEAQAIAALLKPLFAGLSTAPPFGGGQGEAVFRDLLIDQVGAAMVARGGLGLSPHVMAGLIEQQAARQP